MWVFCACREPKALAKKIVEMKSMTKTKLRDMGIRGRNWILKNRKYKMLADNYLKLIFELNN